VCKTEEDIRFIADRGIWQDVEWKNGYCWVYVSGGNRNLKIFGQGIKITEYSFILFRNHLKLTAIEV